MATFFLVVSSQRTGSIQFGRPERGTRPTTASPLSRADAVAEHHQATALT